jgi:hypothetical protein
LILDDWGPDRLTANQRRDLMETTNAALISASPLAWKISIFSPGRIAAD